MIDSLKFNLPHGHDEKQFIRQLADQYSIKKESSVAEKFTIYDTFDWRLFNKSLILHSSGNRLYLRKLTKSKILGSVEFSRTPVFIWDFPDGELKEKLAPIIKMRALLKLVEVRSRSTPYRILDPNEKTVARLIFGEIRPLGDKSRPPLAAHLKIKPVRGYPKYARRMAKSLTKAGLTIATEKEFFLNALAAAGQKPGSYSAKVNIKLDPAMRPDQAVKLILRFLLTVMRINEAVFEMDLDTEVLHDFRVAVRRTRSALAQIKNIFPMRTTNRFKKNFAYLGKLSNDLRDLDVYLLNQNAFKARLCAAVRDDIDPLFEHLRTKRSNAFQHVRRSLKSKKYAKIMKDWETFLNRPPPDSAAASNAGLPVADLARQRIYNKFRGVVKTGRKIRDRTEDEKLHVLRIECKKLRYLMEFFASLFPPKKINALIGQLKNLQDNLGEYNDLFVQQQYLLNVAAELPSGRPRQKKTLVAIGSLVATLDREKLAVKNAFATRFTEFASPENQALFKTLFTSTASKGGP